MKPGCFDLKRMLSLPDEGPEREDFLDHIEGCPGCAAVFETEVVAPLTGLIELAAPGHGPGKPAEVPAETVFRPGPTLRRFSIGALAAALAAACIAAVVIHGQWMRMGVRPHRVEVTRAASMELFPGLEGLDAMSCQADPAREFETAPAWLMRESFRPGEAPGWLDDETICFADSGWGSANVISPETLGAFPPAGFDPSNCPSLLDGTLPFGQSDSQGSGAFDWAPSLQKTYMEVQL